MALGMGVIDKAGWDPSAEVTFVATPVALIAEAVRQALDAGAHGYLGKTASGAELLAALEAVARGERPTPDLHPRRPGVDFPGLSTRESEVLALICEGLSNQEVAERLFVSVNSVKTYIRQVYGKTGVTRRTQAVAWAHRHGWLG